MAKISNISGFPEWLPEEKILEEQIVRTIRSIYESYGFVPIETPAVELLTTLTSKGVVDKELYAVKRLHAEEGEEAELGLHFDLTVPFARYVAQHANNLVYPFKRYQLQKVWRGERPQKGRYREFYQFDIDTVARENLPLSCDAEALSAFEEALSSLSIGAYTIKINNRKILAGFFKSVNLDEKQRFEAVKAIDKVDKIGKDGVLKELKAVGISDLSASTILTLCDYRFPLSELAMRVRDLGIEEPLFLEGVDELTTIGGLLSEQSLKNIEVHLSLARGLDYYTGIIAEASLQDFPEFGSVGGGGRYESLVSDFSNLSIPGVGFSIGITRLIGLILDKKLKSVEKKTFSQVLVAVSNEEARKQSNEIASDLRSRGIASEVYFKSPKLGKQIEFADKKGIHYVLFIGEDGSAFELKNIKTGEQKSYPSLDKLASVISASNCS